MPNPRLIAPLLRSELEEAIELLRSPEGASTSQLMKPLRAARCDAAWKLRGYMQRYCKDLELYSEPMTPARRLKEGYSGGPARVYRVREKTKKSIVIDATPTSLDIFLLGVEYGVKQAEQGRNLQFALQAAAQTWRVDQNLKGMGKTRTEPVIPSKSFHQVNAEKETTDRRTSETWRDQD